MTRRGWILKGEGIECEEELFRFLALPQLGFSSLAYLAVPQLLRNPEHTLLQQVQKGDFIFFPGGFSFADHYGSGRLLSFLLQEKRIFEDLLKKSCHFFGICNGFQVLAQAKLFGEDLRLLHNQNENGEKLHFRNRWVQTRFAEDTNEVFRLSVRHGEGRLDFGKLGKLESHVRPLFYYDDPRFENGSAQKIAGLLARRGESRVIGMMPHPEVSYRPIDDPDFSGPDFNIEHRARKMQATGDGMNLVLKIFEKEKI